MNRHLVVRGDTVDGRHRSTNIAVRPGFSIALLHGRLGEAIDR
jgi:hypothetical protein